MAAKSARFASGKMMLADLPPSSKVTGRRRRPHCSAIICPASVEPVKATLATSGCVTSRPPATREPVMRLMTPAGTPAATAALGLTGYGWEAEQTTQAETRCGCFLPDLTGLARRLSAADLPAPHILHPPPGRKVAGAAGAWQGPPPVRPQEVP